MSVVFINTLHNAAQMIFGKRFIDGLAVSEARQWGSVVVKTLALNLFYLKLGFFAGTIQQWQFRNEHGDSAIWLARLALTLLIAGLIMTFIGLFNFFIVWDRRDKVHFRCAIVILIDLVSLFVAVAICYSFNSIGDASSLQIQPQDARLILYATVADATVHIFAVLYWTALLPLKLRLPNHYQPIVIESKRDSSLTSEGGIPLISWSENSYPLAQLFRKQQMNGKQRYKRTRIEVMTNPLPKGTNLPNYVLISSIADLPR